MNKNIIVQLVSAYVAYGITCVTTASGNQNNNPVRKSKQS